MCPGQKPVGNLGLPWFLGALDHRRCRFGIVARLFSGGVAPADCLRAGFRHHLPTALGPLALRLDMLDAAIGDTVVDIRVLSFMVSSLILNAEVLDIQ